MRGVPLNHGSANPQKRSAGQPVVLWVDLNFFAEGSAGAYYYVNPTTGLVTSVAGFLSLPGATATSANVNGGSGVSTDLGTPGGGGVVQFAPNLPTKLTDDWAIYCEHIASGWPAFDLNNGLFSDTGNGAGSDSVAVALSAGSVSVPSVANGQVAKVAMGLQGGKGKAVANGGQVSTFATTFQLAANYFLGAPGYFGNNSGLGSGCGNNYVRRFKIWKGTFSDDDLKALTK